MYLHWKALSANSLSSTDITTVTISTISLRPRQILFFKWGQIVFSPGYLSSGMCDTVRYPDHKWTDEDYLESSQLHSMRPGQY